MTNVETLRAFEKMVGLLIQWTLKDIPQSEIDAFFDDIPFREFIETRRKADQEGIELD
jgi:hypothetical protein